MASKDGQEFEKMLGEFFAERGPQQGVAYFWYSQAIAMGEMSNFIVAVEAGVPKVPIPALRLCHVGVTVAEQVPTLSPEQAGVGWTETLTKESVTVEFNQVRDKPKEQLKTVPDAISLGKGQLQQIECRLLTKAEIRRKVEDLGMFVPRWMEKW